MAEDIRENQMYGARYGAINCTRWTGRRAEIIRAIENRTEDNLRVVKSRCIRV